MTAADPITVALAALADATKPGVFRLYNAAEDVRIVEAEVEALRKQVKIIRGNLESETFFWKERAVEAEAQKKELVGALEDLVDRIERAEVAWKQSRDGATILYSGLPFARAALKRAEPWSGEAKLTFIAGE